ncbi:hypothetical protein [Accumulibacter sp.]|nr:hypothetical protein [Accumulibacter sp.]MDS4048511.1 hypothetical protein [Accumulibacter sp.]
MSTFFDPPALAALRVVVFAGHLLASGVSALPPVDAQLLRGCE